MSTNQRVVAQQKTNKNHVENKNYTIRLAKPDDMPSLLNIEQACWPKALRVSEKDIFKRMTTYPEGQCVMIQNDQCIGVMYSIRINNKNIIYGHNIKNIVNCHEPHGSKVLFISINILPESRQSGMGDRLLDFMLSFSMAKTGVEKVIAVSRCQNYCNRKDLSLMDYIHQQDHHQLSVDPILRFHQLHGAHIKQLIPNYRPNDIDNQGFGVMVEYPLVLKKPKIIHQSTSNDCHPDNFSETIKNCICEITKQKDPTSLSTDIPFREMGMESLEIAELCNCLNSKLNIHLTVDIFFDFFTIDMVSDYIKHHIQSVQQLSTKEGNSISMIQKDLPKSDDIAVIGMACRFPSARTVTEFWEMLKNGVDAIGTIHETRINQMYIHNKKFPKYGGFLNDIEWFDAKFFKISPLEAEKLDPQHRILLEVSWEAFENAGIDVTNLQGSQTGVFAGIFTDDYKLLLGKALPYNDPDIYFATGNSMATVAGRLSYFYNFHGPCIALDTACSSSLTAVHLACQSLNKKECDLAMACGVNLILSPELSLSFQQAGMLSPDGRCKTFDAKADGYVRSEGCGVILLKPLNRAIDDNNNILAVISGTAINHDGASNGLTAPSGKSQEKLIQTALKNARINPLDISYVETHGTGTILGDPVEIKAIEKAYGKDRSKNSPLILGSVKTNIGHTEAAAGIAGLIKTVLSINHGIIPRHLHFQASNPHISLDAIPAKIPVEKMIWPAEKKRMAGVSSFGFSGTNAHVIISEYLMPKSEPVDWIPIIVLSAKTHHQLKLYAKQLIEFISFMDKQKSPVLISDIAYTLQTGRKAMPERMAAYVTSINDLIKKLQLFCQGETTINNCFYSKASQLPSDKQILHSDIVEKNWNKISQLWVLGATIDWHLLYEGHHKPRPIMLPTYPFEKNRYWIQENDTFKIFSNSKIHPLLHQNISNLEIQQFSSIFTGNEFFLKDHVVIKQKILPGVAGLEMALAAYKASTKVNCNKLGNIVWTRPIVVSDTPQKVLVQLKPSHDHIDFEIWLTENDAPEKLCAQGKLISENFIHQNVDQLNISNIQNKCSKKLDASQVYQQFYRLGYDYGKSFQAIHTLYMGENESLSYLILPSKLKSDNDQYLYHPSLMDGAFQTAIACFNEIQTDNLIYMPFSLKKIIFHNVLPTSCFVYTALQNDTSPTAFDITITDESGRICVQMKGLVLMPVQKEEKPEVIYFKHEWEQKNINILEAPINDKFMIFANINKEKIQAICPNHILVTSGKTYEKVSETHYCICPDNEKHYQQLFEHVDQLPAYMIHLWSKETFKPNDIEIKICLSNSMISLFYISKALLSKQLTEMVRIICVVPPNQPLYEAISGFSKTLALESIRIQIKTVEMPETSDITQKMISECMINDGLEVNYINNIRYVRQLQQIKPTEAINVALKENGVYLITGGSGALGQIFAMYIAEQVQSTIVLCGRKAELNRFQLSQLKGFKSDIVYISADISIQKNVESLIKTIKEKYGNLTGIIHCAGIIQDAFIVKKNIKDFWNVISPKIFGSIYLDDATKKESLDFFVLFSSIASAFGNAGQCDYAYANGFLDAFARYRNDLEKKHHRFGRTLSINWPLWEKGGMSVDVETLKLFGDTSGMLPIQNEQGIDAFQIAISEGLSQIIVSFGHILKIKQMIEKLNFPEGRKVIQTNHNIDSSDTIQQIQKRLLTLISDIIKIDKYDLQTDEDLYDYGFDSITFTQLANNLNEAFNLEITPTLFFEYPTIQKIAFALYSINQNYFNTVYQPKKEFVSNELEIKQQKTIEQKRIKQRFIKHTEFDEKQLSIASKDIAIIGMSGIMPGSSNLNQFWEHLSKGIDLISEVPAERWDFQTFESIPDTYARWGGFIPDVDSFDAKFFNISNGEAELMDPQQRLFLATVWHTIEDAGYKASQLSGSKTGVYVGVTTSDYVEILNDHGEYNAWVSTGNLHSIIANRISYFLDLNGPSEAIDTACSSSLVAIHRAVEAIKNNKCELAIAGGVNAILTPTLNISFSNAGMLSPDGRCKTFDQSANGYVRGEGVGAILLKPLHKAEKDNDHIYAVIKGSAENHGGNSQSLTAPNPNAQKELLIAAYENARIDPSTVTYIEAHGTGTSLGDPIEIDSLKKAFSILYEKHEKTVPKEPVCGIGAVKTNIGHLETAAGIAGVLKLLLSLKYKQLFANLNFNKINPYIKLENSPFYFLTQNKEWKTLTDNNGNPIPRRAGVSSFGFGGSNAHIVFEEYIDDNPVFENNKPQVIVLSAKNKERLDDYANVLLEYCSQNRQNISLVDMAYTLQIGRESMDERLAIVVSDIDDVIYKLSSFTQKLKDQSGIYTGNPKQSAAKKNILIGGKAGESFISIILKTKDLDRIAHLWVMGTEIDWQLLYDIQPKRIGLPTYPFEKKRHWIHQKEGIQNFTGSYGNVTKMNRFFDNFEPLEINKIKQIPKNLNTQGIIQHIQKDLIDLACDILKVDTSEIKIDESFSDFGFESISITQFAIQINEKYNIEIKPSLFFEFPTIEQIASAIYPMNTEYFNKIYQTNKTNDLQEKNTLININKDVQRNHHRFANQRFMHQLNPPNQNIAIIGMSGIMPGSKDLAEFWEYLSKGVDLISEVPADRWDHRKYKIKWGGFIPDIDKFDAQFFSISPKEAELMDPQQRLCLQTIWKTIEDAGYRVSDLSGSRTGIFIGMQGSDYSRLIDNSSTDVEALAITGTSQVMLANRISFLLNLNGPSETIDTACSSSLVAIHRAIHSICYDQCNLAIAGGVNILLTPFASLGLNQTGVLSDDGRCKTFDKAANGYVRSEGVATLLLKPLEQAEADHDHIYAVIKGSAENHGGRASSLTAPNPKAQASLIISAHERAGIDPDTVTFIEAHGTGTSLGDPVEIDALKQAFRHLYDSSGKTMPTNPHCGIGSVKTNIGHLETAAGVAGVIKVIMSMHHQCIPGNIHFKELNPFIELDNSPFYVVAHKQEWKALVDNSGNILPRRAGVSSFGFGGSNAHVVIEEYIDDNPILENHVPQVIVLSAKNKECLYDYAKNLLDHCSQNHQKISIVDMAYTLQIGRESMEERAAIVVSNIDELTYKLSSFIQQSKDQAGIYTGNSKYHTDKKDILVSGEEGKIFINAILQARNVSKIAHLWVLGTEIDWQLLYDKPPKRIALPTYPFEKKRYWLHEKENIQNKFVTSHIHQLHPLVHQNISNLEAQQFSTVLTGNEFFLMDHV
ncbi:MAG: SDR family NAD(P)-dependent oxidoreductase, partial [Candidatus Magnetomorum sp.]|nr:SDR family NAD(P)-dependent oxidoreductase [Candidatus Magnetomorum sp.]